MVAAPPPEVTIGDVHAGSFDLKLVTYVRSEGWLAAQSDLKRELVARLAERQKVASHGDGSSRS